MSVMINIECAHFSHTKFIPVNSIRSEHLYTVPMESFQHASNFGSAGSHPSYESNPISTSFDQWSHPHNAPCSFDIFAASVVLIMHHPLMLDQRHIARLCICTVTRLWYSFQQTLPGHPHSLFRSVAYIGSIVLLCIHSAMAQFPATCRSTCHPHSLFRSVASRSIMFLCMLSALVRFPCSQRSLFISLDPLPLHRASHPCIYTPNLGYPV